MDSNKDGHLSDYLPVSNPQRCFWASHCDELASYRSSSSLPEYSDVVIIGGGYAGVSTAYHLIKDHADVQRSITILEARGACTGATGRNGGHLRPDFYGFVSSYLHRFGPEAALEVAEFEIAHLAILKDFIQREGIDCDFTLTRSLDVWCDLTAARTAKETYDLLLSRNFEYMKDVMFYTSGDMEGLSGVKGAVGCASFPAGTMWPAKFIMHLLRSIIDKINLQTNTPVTNVRPGDRGGFVITTPRGFLHAGKVVHANNAYAAGLLPQYAKNIIPCKNLCCRIIVPEDVRPPGIHNSYILRDKDNVLSYLIPRSDRSIIVGGASAISYPFTNQWYRTVDDSSLIPSSKNYYHDYMQRTFYGWENTGAHIDDIWTGIIGYSYDSRPHIGLIPQQQHQYIIAGFNGHGMPVIWLSAKELASMVAKEIAFEETNIPKLFKTTQARIDAATYGREEDGDILRSSTARSTRL